MARKGRKKGHLTVSFIFTQTIKEKKESKKRTGWRKRIQLRLNCGVLSCFELERQWVGVQLQKFWIFSIYITPQLSCNCMSFCHLVLFLDSSFSFTTNVLEVVTTARCACCTWWRCAAGGGGSRFRLLFPKYHETSVRPLLPSNHIRYLKLGCYTPFLFLETLVK